MMILAVAKKEFRYVIFFFSKPPSTLPLPPTPGPLCGGPQWFLNSPFIESPEAGVVSRESSVVGPTSFDCRRCSRDCDERTHRYNSASVPPRIPCFLHLFYLSQDCSQRQGKEPAAQRPKEMMVNFWFELVTLLQVVRAPHQFHSRLLTKVPTSSPQLSGTSPLVHLPTLP